MTRISRRLKDEQGQALVLAIAIVVMGLLLGLGAVAYAMQASTEGTHDERARGAQQAADAGVQRELYLNTDSDNVGYNLNSGVLGLGTFLDCTVPELGVGATTLNLQVGTVQVAAGSAGVCPSSCTSATACTSGPPGKNGWQELGNQDYYETDFFTNAQETATPGSATAGNGAAVEFPEILSIGCHTTNATDPLSACLNGGNGNSYYRQLALLDPTGPLQTVEGTNDVTINSGLNLLNSLVSTQDITCNKVSVLGIGLVTECTATNANGLLGALVGTINSLVGSVCGTLAILTTGSNQSCVVNQIVTTLDNSLGSVGLVDGNIAAGYNLTLPSITVDAQLSTNSLAALGSLSTALTGILTDVGNVVTLLSNPQTLDSTFTYGNQVCPPSGTGCSSAATDSTPVTAVAPNFVKSSGTCQAGKPQSNCVITRPSFSVTSALTQAATSGTSTIPAAPTGSTSSPTLTGTGASASYVDGDLTLTSGTLTLSPGTYVFCGVYASGGTIAGGGGVQVFVLAPGAPQCTTQPTAGTTGYVQPGNFVSCTGVDNTLGDTSLYSLGTVTSTLTPSAFQIYVQGNTTDADGSALTVSNKDSAVTTCPNMNKAAGTEPYTTSSTPLYNSTKDPATQVYIGSLSGSATEGLIVYAPQSEVTVNAIAAFEGSAVGFNSDITAVALLQDLDLGNYPLSPVANAYQVSQTIQCNSAIEATSGSDKGNPPQHSTAATTGQGPTSSGGVGDLNGC